MFLYFYFGILLLLFSMPFIMLINIFLFNNKDLFSSSIVWLFIATIYYLYKEDQDKKRKLLYDKNINYLEKIVESSITEMNILVPIKEELSISFPKIINRDLKSEINSLKQKWANQMCEGKQFDINKFSKELFDLTINYLPKCEHGIHWGKHYPNLCEECIIKNTRKNQKINTSEENIYKNEVNTKFKLLEKKYGFELAQYIFPKSNLSNEELGKRYERYIGYLFEVKGYKVEYHGINKGKEDRGIDIIAKYKKGIEIIQCKRWGQDKLIRENAITQLIGTFEVFKKENPSLIIEAHLFSPNDNLDSRAKQTLEIMGIKHSVEVYPFDKGSEYPLIKCNIGKNGEKIYHLPNDASYDRIKIEISKGEFYALTPSEAIEKGFRRSKS